MKLMLLKYLRFVTFVALLVPCVSVYGNKSDSLITTKIVIGTQSIQTPQNGNCYIRTTPIVVKKTSFKTSSVKKDADLYSSWLNTVVLLCSVITAIFSIITICSSIKWQYQKKGRFLFDRQEWRKKHVVIHIIWTILCVVGVVGLIYILLNHICIIELIRDTCNRVDAVCGLNDKNGSGYPILINIATTFIALVLAFRILRPRLLIYPEALYEQRAVEDRHQKTGETYTHLLFQVWNKGLFTLSNLHVVLYACKREKDTMNTHRCEIPMANHDYVTMDWSLAHPDDSRLPISTQKNAFDYTRGYDYLELQITATHPMSNVSRTFSKKFHHENIHRGKFMRKKWWHVFPSIYFFDSKGFEQKRKKSWSVKMICANVFFTLFEYLGCIALAIVVPITYYWIYLHPECVGKGSLAIEIILLFVLLIEIIRKVTLLPVKEPRQESCLYYS